MLLKRIRLFSSSSKVLRQGQLNAGYVHKELKPNTPYERALKDSIYIREVNAPLKAHNTCAIMDRKATMMRSKNQALYRAICGHFITKNSRNMFAFIFQSMISTPKNMLYVVNLTEFWKYQESFYRLSRYLESQIFDEAIDSMYDCKKARELIALVCNEIDKVDIDAASLVLTNDHVKALDLILDAVIDSENCGVMLTKPFVAQWNDLANFKKVKPVYYSLEYESNWDISIDEVYGKYEEARAAGTKPRILLVSNPHEVIGSVMQRKSIEQLMYFCYEKSLLMYVDESNRHIVSDNGNFVSVRRVLRDMPEPIRNSLQIVVNDSIKSSYIFDSGFRSAFVELINFDTQSRELIRQISDLNPPSLIDLSIVLLLYIMNSFALTSKLADKDFANSADHFCNQYFIETRFRQLSITKTARLIKDGDVPEFAGGLHYLMKFPFPQKFVDFARGQGKEPDYLFCEILFEEEKIVSTPGSSFGCETSDFIQVIRLSLVDVAFMDVFDRLRMAFERLKEDYK